MIRINDVIRNGLASARVLGIREAARLHRLKARRSEALTRIQVRGLPGSLLIRPRGTDLHVVLQTFETRDYGLAWCAPYRAHMQAVIRQTIMEGKVPLVIDAGANIGASTALFAAEFPGCQIYAIEPNLENFKVLHANVGGRPDVILFHAALWDKPDNLSMLHPGTGWGCRVQEDPGSNAATFPGVTIPELLARDIRLRPVVVKIDIEGAETSALRTNNAWADQVLLMIYEQHDNLWHWLGPWQGGGDAFNRMLSRKKREYLRRGENDYAFLHPEEIAAAAVSM